MSWIKLHRKLLEWEYATDGKMMVLWMHLLLMANFEDGEFMGATIKRGQFATSISRLADIVKMTKKEVRTRLSKLEKLGQIAISTVLDKPKRNGNTSGEQVREQVGAHLFTLITICKYEDYQVGNNTNGNRSRNRSRNRSGATIKEYTIQPLNKSICISTLIASNNLPKEEGRKEVQTEVCPAPLNPQYQNFVGWCEKNAPEVMKMKHPMTEEQFSKLHQEFGSRALADIVGEMSNWKPLIRKNTSAYLTALKWLKGRRAEAGKGQPKSKFAETAEQMARMHERLSPQQQQEETQIDYGVLRQISEV